MAEEDWIQLAERARLGDNRACTQLIVRFEPFATATARRLVAADDVLDVTQDAFEEVLTTIAHLRTPAAFPAWLRLIVRKHADRVHRRSRRGVPTPRDEAPPTQPHDAAERNEIVALVRAALSTLSDPDRRLLELRYYAGWTVADLADLLNINDSAVRKRLHDARRRLRSYLSPANESREPAMSSLFDYLSYAHAAADIDLANGPELRQLNPPIPTPTGLKIVDAMAPVARGGTIEIAGAYGTGHLVIALELLFRLGRTESETACVAVGPRASGDEPYDFSILIDDSSVARDRHCVILTDSGDDQARAVRSAANLAAGLAETGTDVLLVIDRRVISDIGVRNLAGIGPSGGSVTVLVVAAYPRRGPRPDLAELDVDTHLVLSIEQFAAGIFPALDPVVSRSSMSGAQSAAAVRDQIEAADRLRRYFGQPMHASEAFTNEPAVWVDQVDAEVELQRLLSR